MFFIGGEPLTACSALSHSTGRPRLPPSLVVPYLANREAKSFLKSCPQYLCKWIDLSIGNISDAVLDVEAEGRGVKVSELEASGHSVDLRLKLGYITNTYLWRQSWTFWPKISFAKHVKTLFQHFVLVLSLQSLNRLSPFSGFSSTFFLGNCLWYKGNTHAIMVICSFVGRTVIRL